MTCLNIQSTGGGKPHLSGSLNGDLEKVEDDNKLSEVVEN